MRAAPPLAAAARAAAPRAAAPRAARNARPVCNLTDGLKGAICSRYLHAILLECRLPHSIVRTPLAANRPAARMTTEVRHALKGAIKNK